MANAFANPNSHNFWKEVRNSNRSCYCKSHTPVIDDIHDPDNIALHFSNKLRTLLALDSSSTCDSLLGQINNNLGSEDLNLVSISIPCVRTAFSLLKPHKNDGANLSSNHFIRALPAIKLLRIYLLVYFVMVICPLFFMTVFWFLFLRGIKIRLFQITIALLL